VNTDFENRQASLQQKDGFLKCSEWFLVALTLSTVVLVYPLRLSEEWQRQLFGGLVFSENPLHKHLWSIIEAYVNFYHSPLILKGALAGILILALVAVAAIRQVLAPVNRIGKAVQGCQTQGRKWLCLILFLAWSLASVFWSPTPRLSGSCAWWLVVYMVFWYILMRRGFSHAEKNRLIKLFLLLGIPVLLIIFLQAFPVFAELTYSVFHRFEDKRNRFGSLLGHNSAAASFLLMTWFPVMAGMLKSESRLFRSTCLVYLSGCLVAFVILQTRAIWLMAPVLCFLFMRSSFRHSGLRFKSAWISTLFLAVIALVILSQVIRHPSNPFYVRTDTLAERLGDISPSGIAGDSRLRLNLISMRLVPQHPIRGHGLHAYQYIYPKEQGWYFRTHPDSGLNQTIARSHMAHNEYLQLLIDHGLIGLILLIWIFRDILYVGLGRKKALSGSDRIIQESFGCSSLAVALHAFVDFPFHVPQLLVTGMIVSAAWAGGVDPEPSGDSRGEPEALAGQDDPDQVVFLSSKFRLEPFARLLFSFILAGLVPVAAVPFVKCLKSDIGYARGTAHLNQFYMSTGQMTAEERAHSLNKSIHYFNRSIQILPTQYLSMLKAADAHLQLGRLYHAQARFDPSMKKMASDEFFEALEMVDRAGKGLDYHGIYYQRGLIARELHKLDPSLDFDEVYIRQMRQSLNYCPVHTLSAYLLAEFMTGLPGVDPGEINRLRQHILKNDPALFINRYLHMAHRFVADRRFNAAALAREQILSVDPENPIWIVDAARANLLDGNLERAAALIRLIEQKYPEAMYLYGGGLIRTALTPGIDGMEFLIQLSNSRTEEAEERAFFRAIELEAIDRTDQYQYAEQVAFERPALVNPEEWEIMVREIRPYVLLYYFREPGSAREALNLIIQDDRTPSVEVLLDGVYIGLSMDDFFLAQECLDQARSMDPDHPALDELGRRIQLNQELKRPGDGE
jgi:tetratricopeptide (TPR) repeat protein